MRSLDVDGDTESKSTLGKPQNCINMKNKIIYLSPLRNQLDKILNISNLSFQLNIKSVTEQTS